jgi:two-component system alkaline phosphatase synthesis response regulator PhoP
MFWYVGDKNQEAELLMAEIAMKRITVVHFSKIADAFEHLKNEVPEGILIDADQREISSVEFCHKVKSSSAYKQIVLIVVSSDHSESIEEILFDAGVDEFVFKPIRHQAFLKRILSRLNKDSIEKKIIYNEAGKSSLHIDRESFSVYLNQKIVPLSKKEFELLHLIASQPGKVFTREEIFNKVWNRKHISKERTIDVHILRLRKKIGDEFITTQKGIGYRFCA